MPMRLGEILVKAEAISEKQLQAGVAEQQRWGGLLGEILVRMEYLSEETLVLALSRQLGVPKAEPQWLDTPEERAVRKLTHEVAKNLRSVPLALQEGGKVLVVAMAEPQNLSQIDELRKVTGCKLAPRLVGPGGLTRLLNRAYGSADATLEEEVQDEDSFKMLNAQGSTLIKSMDQVRAEAGIPPPVEESRTQPAPPSASRPPPVSRPPSLPPPPPPPVAGDDSVRSLLQRLEEGQRKEVAALRAMVELLIDRGVFSREEYLARIRR
jgi:hypothetical protein